MKKIVILYEDGYSLTKKENDITKDDLHMAKYFLIPVDDNSRTYSIIKPSKYLSFTKAIIDYQLCGLYEDNEETRVVWSEGIDPVHIETTSICDLISLINCVDRLNIVNLMMNGDDTFDEQTQIGLSFLSIQLFSDDTIIYESSYCRENVYSSSLYDSYSISKKFKKIYSPHIIGEIWSTGEVIGLITLKKGSFWEIGSNIDQYSLIGIPQVDTNLITFLTQEEYISIQKIRSCTSGFLIFYTKSETVSDLSSNIAGGAPVAEIEKIIDYLEDVYVGAEYYVPCNHFSTGDCSHVVSVFANALFSLTAAKLIYSQLYPYDLPFREDVDQPEETWEFGTLLRLTLTLEGNPNGKVVFMNQYSFIDIQTLLYAIGEEV